MFCERCKNTVALPQDAEPGIARMPLHPLGELGALICEACGSVLPPPEATPGRIRKMAQLARFGIGVNRRTLLEP